MFLEKLILGVTLAAPIGPVSTEMIRRGLKYGFWPAMTIRIGSSIGHCLFLVIAYFAVASIQENRSFLNIVSLSGALMLIYMGCKNLFKESKVDIDNLASESIGALKSLWLGFVLALVNPVSVVFWVGIFAASVANSDNDLGLMYNMLIMVGVLLWGIALSTVLTIGKIFLTNRFIKVVVMVSSIVMMCYGAKYEYNSISFFVG